MLDARSAGRFAGTEPEPRAGLRGGHIPGSLNLPYETLYRPDGTLKPPDELREAVTRGRRGPGPAGRHHVRLRRHGLGARAGALPARPPDVAVYDGSWSEWGSRSDTPVET